MVTKKLRISLATFSNNNHDVFEKYFLNESDRKLIFVSIFFSSCKEILYSLTSIFFLKFIPMEINNPNTTRELKTKAKFFVITNDSGKYSK